MALANEQVILARIALTLYISNVGEKLVNFLVEPKKGTKWPSNLPRFENRTQAIAVAKDLCKYGFVHRSEKRGKGQLAVSTVVQYTPVYTYIHRYLSILFKRRLTHFSLLDTQQVSRVRDFDEAGYFTWMYEGDKTFSHLMTTALVVGFLFCTCFPIWPNFLKVFVWYMSVTLLIFIFFLVTARALAFLFVWMAGYDFWFLPNLFDETLSFTDSFKPVIYFEKSKPGQFMYRIGVAVAFFSFCYWAVTQPSEFDGFVAAQGDFLKDLYAGTLLSDMSQKDKENIDKPKVQSLEDLLTKLDEEEEEEEKMLSEEEKLDSLLENLVDEEEEIDEEEE